ncbi:MAG TPA: glycosyltransferase [Chitinophagaceae bacterium]|nr:glycosyltransferase [Chitinophagaceae bacterium]
MQLSVIIVNYNVKYFLEQCLCSVIKAIKNTGAEIFVVDNNSSDGSREFFNDRFTRVKFIWNNENLGFSKANNIAVKQATGKYILFLNPDTLLPEDCIENCLTFLESHPEAGALGIKMLDGSGIFLKESKRSFPSPVTSFYKLSGLAKLFPHSKIFGKYHLGHLDENQNHEVDVLAGAFMMVPKNVIERVGSFDEDFFMYGEDIDLSYRVQEAGYKNIYFSESSIVHFKGESTKKGGLNYVRLFYKAMSIFARKHYGHRAAFFNLLIRLGILVRAFLSAIKRFIKWIGMPVIDGGIILMSFWVIKFLWNMYIKREVNYSPNMLIIAFPVFTLIFLIASYYSGLYDNGFKQRRLNHSTIIAFALLLSFYALLPEHLRFSRGILVFGSLLAFLLMTLIRWFLLKWKVIEKDEKSDENRQTFIIGTEEEFFEVNQIMQNAGMEERVLGRIKVNGEKTNATGNIDDLKEILNTYSIKEIIFCEGRQPFKKIISLVKEIPKRVRIKFHAENSAGIIGSDSTHTSGKFISADKKIKLSLPISKRNKNFIDAVTGICFLVTFPVHFITQKKPFRFFRNVIDILFLNRTWVGYALPETTLPKIKKGILTTTGLPPVLNTLPLESLRAADKWYATDYEVWTDIRIIWRGYKYLGE